jgi:hypothetical protein
MNDFTAGWLILSFFAISMVFLPSLRCAQKHKSNRALSFTGLSFPIAEQLAALYNFACHYPIEKFSCVRSL